MSLNDCCGSQLTVYLSRDNAIVVVPYKNIAAGEVYPMDAVTRVTAACDPVDSTVVGDAVIGDSAVDPLFVFWNDDASEWRIFCKAGLFTGMYAGVFNMRITIYDPDNPNGLVLPDPDDALQITVVDLP